MTFSQRLALLILMTLCLTACRPDRTADVRTKGPPVRLEGIYRLEGTEQLAQDCKTGKKRKLRDTPDGELRRHADLFDHPPETVLRVELQGHWLAGADSVFLITSVDQIERRGKTQGCR